MNAAVGYVEMHKSARSGRSLRVAKALTVFFALVCLAFSAQAASFDCAKASTEVEELICGDAELSKLDEEMAVAYQDALRNDKQLGSIRKAQQRWLKERNRCTDIACVKHVYKTRLEMMSTSKALSKVSAADLINQTQNSVRASKPLTEKYLRGHGFKVEPFTFKLTKGHGIPVCEAYLQRLNDTDFDLPPFCGRPENDSVPGFTRLNRVPLTAEVIHRLIPRIEGFEGSQDQNYWIRQKKEFMNIDSVRSYIGMQRLGAWQYDPPVDIDNDGKPDNILIWFGGGGYACGSINYNSAYPAVSSYRPYILDDQNLSIDEARTRELFQHPKGWLNIPSKGFRHIGFKMGIFQYQGVFYFDTFFESSWGDYEGKRRNSNEIGYTLAVFQRKDKKTKQLCEYCWTNANNLYPRGK